MCTQPILRCNNVSKEVAIQCDASEVGLGATLLQKGQPVGYASRALPRTEEQYAQSNKNVWRLYSHVNIFINTALAVTIQSDCKPLEIIFRKPQLTAPKRLQKM